MPRRSDLALCVALTLALAGGPGCSRFKAGLETETAEVGHHRVRFVLPKGWEHLDHGRQQLFRSGEAQISLVDLGPGTREAMASELRAADSLWRAGRRKDAFQRVHQLRSPALRFAEHQRRANFWKPWTDATYIPEVADSFALRTAFAALIEGTSVFPEVTPGQVLEYVLTLATDMDMRRREIARRERRMIHGSAWIEAETWDRVSHLYPSRVAFHVNNGYLLALAIDHGRFEEAGPAFETLLNSFEVTGGVPRDSLAGPQRAGGE